MVYELYIAQHYTCIYPPTCIGNHYGYMVGLYHGILFNLVRITYFLELRNTPVNNFLLNHKTRI